jgi:recombination protein RecA
MTSSIDLIKQFHKDYGPQIGGQGMKVMQVRRLPTGVFPFDLGIGGGFLRGRVNTIYGPEQSGKTSMAYKAIIRTQRNCWECGNPMAKCACSDGPSQMKAVLIDAEHAYDAYWSSMIGVSHEDLIILQPDYAEQAVDMAEAMMGASDVGLVVIDSIPALTKTSTIEKSAEVAVVGGNSLIVSVLMSKMVSALSRASKQGRDPCLICINQIRTKIGQMYGDPEAMPGGHSLKFNSRLIVRLYGKDEMDKSVSDKTAAYKEISVIVKKAQCPIVDRNITFKLALIPQEGLVVGDCPGWNTCAAYLKTHKLVTRNEKGDKWLCLGMAGDFEEYKTLSAIQERYNQDDLFREFIHRVIVELELGKPE